MRLAGENAPHQVREHVARAKLDEDSAAGSIHRRDLGLELHRAHQLLTEDAPHVIDVHRIGRRRDVGVHRYPGQHHVGIGHCGRERLPRMFDQIRMKGSGHRQRRDAQPPRGELVARRRNRCPRPTQHHLIRCIDICQHNPGQLCHQRCQQRRASANRQHRTRIEAVLRGWWRHRAPACIDQPLVARIVERTRRPQRRQLAKTVARRAVGPQAGPLKHAELPGTERADRRLGAVSRLERRRVIAGCTGRRKDQPRQRGIAVGDEASIEAGIPVTDVGEVDRQLAAHLGVLRALASEECSQLAGHGVLAIPDAGVMPRLGCVVAAQALCRPLQRALRGSSIGRQHADACMRLGDRPWCVRSRERRPRRRGIGQPLRQRVACRRQRQCIDGVEQKRHRAGMHAVCRRVFVPMLLDHDVVIGSAEAKGAHRPATWLVGSVNPRPRRRVQVERRLVDVKLRVGRRCIDRRRQHLVVQRQRHLDQASRTRSGLGMADLRLDAAQRDLLALRARCAKHVGQRLELGQVAGRRAGAVCLDQADARRIDGGIGIGPPQRTNLPFGAWCVDAAIPPVARSAHATDHRIDPVAITLRIGQPLQHQHAHAFAHDHPVGIGGERARRTTAREGWCLREAQVDERRIVGIDAAGDHHIGIATGQLADRHAQRTERTGTRSIDDTVHAAQIEPVGDPPRDDVAEHSGERVLLPWDVRQLDLLDDLVGLGALDAAAVQCAPPDRLLQSCGERGVQLLRARHAQHDTSALAQRCRHRRIAGVAQRLARDDQRQHLRDVCHLEDVRRHAELDGVERYIGQKPATLAVGLVGHARVGVIVIVDRPARGRYVLDAVARSDDVAPVLLHIARLREDPRQTDDRNRHCRRHELHYQSNRRRSAQPARCGRRYQGADAFRRSASNRPARHPA